jgi:molybdenum cofactor synthesis domain-containing protein
MVPLNMALETVGRMRRDFFISLDMETIPVSTSLDRRLAFDAHAAERCPRFNMSTVDGYAVRVADGFPVRIIRDVYAGDGSKVSLGPGETVYVGTGAAVPEGADAVHKIEDVGAEDNVIISGLSLGPGENLVYAGSDFESGDAILEKGTVIGPSAICAMAAAGIERVPVYRRIRAGVLSTGDEIKNGMVRNCNAPMVCAMLQRWGCEAVHLGVVPDDPIETKAILNDAAARFDLLITIGGISVGKKDYVASTIMEGGVVVFRGYRVRPGKPLLVSYYNGKPVFSLPGKPTGAFTSMELIVKRFILGDTAPVCVTANLDRDVDVKAGDFEHVVYVQLKGGNAVPMGYEGSPLELFPGPQYRVSLVSSSPRAIVADGYFIASQNVGAGRPVEVFLLL